MSYSFQQVFGPMKKENPYFNSKITVISGDVSQPGLGISELDKKRIVNEVTVIFHGAATVRFDEKLRKAIKINIFGTKQLLDLAAECRNLKVIKNCLDEN